MRNRWLESDDEALTSDCILDFHKASGNGGQKVNKTSSAVRLTHRPTGEVVSCAESRSQHENRHLALKQLRMRLALTIREEQDSGFRPGNPPPSLKNAGYPLWTAKILDVFASHDCDLKTSGESLEISASRFARLLWRDPVLWNEANRMRKIRNLPPLRSME